LRVRGRFHRFARWAALALLAVAAPIVAQDFKILHYESIPGFDAARPRAASAFVGGPGEAAKPPPSAPAWSFVAFGRQFDVELEPNERLLRGLAPEHRDRLGDVELYAGRLAGLPGSWVRLARHRGVVSGVIFDGATLYGVEPERDVARHAVAPGAGDGDGIAIYRWQDTSGALRDEVVLSRAGAGDKLSDAERLAAMTSALPTPVGVGAQLDIALVADELFVEREGQSAEATALSIMNVVDGIYVMQLGIHLNLADLVLLDGEGPFTTTDARSLLSELEEYKSSIATFRDSGLAHLFTGRDLDESSEESGQQVGIANLGVVCHDRFGAALTQATLGLFSSALVAAHEIGHNFGAPHDGEEGSPCESEPETYLMAPSVSGGREFSACSIEQMADEVASASCLTPLPPTNVSIAITQPPPADVDQDAPFEIGFEIRNDGPAIAQSPEITIESDGLDGPEFVSTSNDLLEDCDDGPPAYCRQPRLEPGEVATYRVRFSPLAAGPTTIDFAVSALNDTDASDDVASATVNVRPFVDLASELDVDELLVYPDEEIRIAGTVSNVGLVPASSVVAELGVLFLYDIVNVDAGGADCNLVENGFNRRIQCHLGELAGGEQRPISWTLRPRAEHADDLRVVEATLEVSGADAEHPSVIGNNAASTRLVRTRAKGDIVTTIEAASSFRVGDAVQLVARVSNEGPDDARDVTVAYGETNRLGDAIDSVSATAGECTVSAAASDFECRVEQLAAGAEMVVTFSGTAATLGTYRLTVTGTAEADPNTANDTATHAFDVIASSTPAPSSGGGGGAAGIAMLLGLLAAAPLRSAARARRRSRARTARLLLSAVAAAAALAPFAASAQSAGPGPDAETEPAADAPPRSPGIELPDGDGKLLVETACLPCHDLAGIAAFKGYWNREQWAAMVATMIGHGARLDEAETEIVVDYLTAHFGRGPSSTEQSASQQSATSSSTTGSAPGSSSADASAKDSSQSHDHDRPSAR